jgi:hypothetical protein
MMGNLIWNLSLFGLEDSGLYFVRFGHGHLPVQRGRRSGRLRGVLLHRPGAAVLLPPLVRERRARLAGEGTTQGGRVGADHPPDHRFFLQGGGNHARAGADPRVGNGRGDRARRILCLLPAQGRQGEFRRPCSSSSSFCFTNQTELTSIGTSSQLLGFASIKHMTHGSPKEKKKGMKNELYMGV